MREEEIQQVSLWVLMWEQRLNRGPRICTSKPPWSGYVPANHGFIVHWVLILSVASASSFLLLLCLCLSLTHTYTYTSTYLNRSQFALLLLPTDKASICTRAQGIVFCFWVRVPCSPGWPQICHVAKDDFELLFPCAHHRSPAIIGVQYHVHLGIEPKAPCVPGKCSSNWATPPGLDMVFAWARHMWPAWCWDRLPLPLAHCVFIMPQCLSCVSWDDCLFPHFSKQPNHPDGFHMWTVPKS